MGRRRAGRYSWRCGGPYVADAGQGPSKAELDRYLQTAWHGSPHEFDDFSTDSIGAGEGAQVYGWGLYFAEKRAGSRALPKRAWKTSGSAKDGRPHGGREHESFQVKPKKPL